MGGREGGEEMYGLGGGRWCVVGVVIQGRIGGVGRSECLGCGKKRMNGTLFQVGWQGDLGVLDPRCMLLKSPSV